MFFAPWKPKTTVFTMFFASGKKNIVFTVFSWPVPSKNTSIYAIFSMLQVPMPRRKKHCKLQCFGSALRVRGGSRRGRRIQDQMLDVVPVVDDGDDARRAPQGIILVVLSQFLKAFGTNYLLRVIPTK